MNDAKPRTKSESVAGLVAGALIILAAALLAASLCSALSGPAIPNMFRPE